MSLPEDVRRLPGLVTEGDEPVFAEPWQAQAFAMTVKLHEKGLFTWAEWAAALSAEIAAAGPDDPAENYYMHWLAALEKISQEKGALSETERLERKDAWDRAAKATPHGSPIELGAETRS
ncbi:MAG: nitrile hydratase accessory protein [Pseudomonadota bacterium]